MKTDEYFFDPQYLHSKIFGCVIKHGLKIYCNAEIIKELKNNSRIANKYNLNICREREGYTVYFQDKTRVKKVLIDGKEYDKYF